MDPTLSPRDRFARRRTGVRSRLVALIGITWLGAAGAAVDPEPSAMVEFEAYSWSRGVKSTDDLLRRVRRGDTLMVHDGMERFPFLASFLVVLRAEPSTVYVRGHELHSSPDADSIPVTAAWRRFDSRSVDAGSIVGVRVVDPKPLVPPRSTTPLRIDVKGPWMEGGSGDVARAAEAIGIFRLLAVSPGVIARDSIPHRLRVLCEEAWAGSVAEMETLTISVSAGVATDTTWGPLAIGTPLQKGRRAILFLRDGQSAGHRAFVQPWNSCALIADPQELVFSPFVRGEPLGRFRRDIERSRRWHRDPTTGSILGMWTDAELAAPGDVSIWVEGGSDTVRPRFDGEFQLDRIPIGPRWLVASTPCGRRAGLVYVRDGTTDSLVVGYHCADRGSPTVHEDYWAEGDLLRRRARQTKEARDRARGLFWRPSPDSAAARPAVRHSPRR